MLVRDCMTHNPITVHPHSDPLAAIALLKSARVRRLPVVDAQGTVVGIVTLGDLERFLSKAPPPGILKRQHHVEQAMITPVVTVSPEHPVEEAARLMVEHKIGSLPVIENNRLVGIITETDIFKQFVGILGGNAQAIRLTVQVPDVCGQLAKVLTAVADLGCNIHSVIIHRTAEPGFGNVTLWVQGAEQDKLTTSIESVPEVTLLQVWNKY